MHCVVLLLWQLTSLTNTWNFNFMRPVLQLRLVKRPTSLISSDQLCQLSHFIRPVCHAMRLGTDRVLFLTEISVFLSILLISYQDFGILIDLVVYLTEYLGKIDQSLQTGLATKAILFDLAWTCDWCELQWLDALFQRFIAIVYWDPRY